MIAVAFALPHESSAFVKLLKRAALNVDEVRVLHTGVGAAACTAAIRRFLGTHSPRVVISSGFAGALTNELQLADLLLAENFTSAEWLERSHEILGGRERRGVLATASTIADTPAARAELAQRSGAIAVDMETECIAAACREASVSMISLRAISDTPSAPLPAPPHVLFDVEAQQTNYGALARYVATHPSSALRLILFARRIASARERLAKALTALIGAL